MNRDSFPGFVVETRVWAVFFCPDGTIFDRSLEGIYDSREKAQAHAKSMGKVEDYLIKAYVLNEGELGDPLGR